MKKVMLQKIEQFGSVCYIGKIDPRALIKVAAKIGIGDTQDAQRPLSEKRIKQIAGYVGNENGMLPNTLTLATKDDKFEVADEGNGFYSILFPSESFEFENYADTVDVMDGQHRLYSFSEDIRQISNNDKYEIGFTLYIRPTLNERRRIFVICNEKQEKVSGNLLMWFKEKLQMISYDERELYNIVAKLNGEYPLKGRVIMSAEKIKNGIKANEIMKIVKQAKIREIVINGERISEDDIVKIICVYLSAWEKIVDFKFASPSKNDGAAVKQAGLRYMLLLLPTVWDKALVSRRKFDEEFVKDTLARFISACGIVRNVFFTCEENKLKFRDRSVTEQFAADSIAKIKSLDTGNFNPLG